MTTNTRLFSANKDEEQCHVAFSFNGRELTGYEGEPIAAALLANGIKTIRNCEVTGEPRGLYCGIGHCYECRADVDGIANLRTCMTPLRSGAIVSTQSSWQIEGARK